MRGLLLGFLSLFGMTAILWGADFGIKLPGIEDEVLVSLPSNHEAGKKYPAVFYYHGTGGRPSHRLMRGHTGDKDWIVVGMAYAKRGLLELTPTGMDEEQKVFREVRKRLQAEAGLDPTRVYVAGFSKGGWMSGLLLQKEKSLAGAAILGAGHSHELQASPPPLREGTPVFLGVGRADNNYPFSLRARVFFEKLGAEVEMETWRGLKHEFPNFGSTGLKEWFALRNGGQPDEAALEEELNEILNRENAFERWWALLEFQERPFVQAAEGWEQRVFESRLEMEQTDESIAREVRILQLSRRSLAKELEVKTLPILEEIVSGYATIMESGGDSPQVAVAALDFERTGAILDAGRKQFAEAEQRRKEIEVDNGFDNDRRRIPRNPLVR